MIIPTRDRPDRLRACLGALSVSFPSDAEVVVVSDGCDRSTFPDLSELRAALNLCVLHVPHGGPAKARNHALEVVRGRVVAFLDDDCLPETEWLERLTDAVSLDPPIAVGGGTKNGVPSNPYDAASQLILDMAEYDQRRRDYRPSFFPSNNLAFPTDRLRELGGFNPAFRTAEDRELCRRWLKAGHGLARAPAAVLAHAPRLDLARFWRQFVAYGEGAAMLHSQSGPEWRSESLAFHMRVPMLAAGVAAEQRLRRRGTLAALLVVWEIANFVGFLRQKRNRHPRADPSKPGS